MSNRVCVVTGANKGIGLAVAKELCRKFDGIVYLTARDEGRGRTAVQQLEQEGLKVSFYKLDVDNEGSIKAFADHIRSTHGGLDCLVNNAAIAYKAAATESMGVQAEDTIRVNYFGLVNVCHALFPLLRPHARVVNLSSLVGHLSRINGEEPNATHLRAKFASESLTEDELSKMMKEFVRLAKEGGWKEAGWCASTYAASKVGVSALTRIQQRAFNSDPREDLVVNSCHPGYVDTDMTSHKGPMTVEEGSVCPTYLALLPPNIKEPKGAYLWSRKEVVDWVNGPTPHF